MKQHYFWVLFDNWNHYHKSPEPISLTTGWSMINSASMMRLHFSWLRNSIRHRGHFPRHWHAVFSWHPEYQLLSPSSSLLSNSFFLFFFFPLQASFADFTVSVWPLYIVPCQNSVLPLLLIGVYTCTVGLTQSHGFTPVFSFKPYILKSLISRVGERAQSSSYKTEP